MFCFQYNIIRHLMCFLAIVLSIHYLKSNYYFDLNDFHSFSAIDVVQTVNEPCSCNKYSSYEYAHLSKEVFDLKAKIDELEAWKNQLLGNFNEKLDKSLDTFYTDQIGMFDFACETSGGAIISTPDTNPYPTKRSLKLFGTINWILTSEPNYIIQGRNAPGQCYAFYGNKGRIRIKLSRFVRITHISLEHFKSDENNYHSIAPKNFEILGLDEYFSGEFLGNFTYNISGRVIQTFNVIPKNKTYNFVELRILDNYGNNEFTCVYRFRVHSVY